MNIRNKYAQKIDDGKSVVSKREKRSFYVASIADRIQHSSLSKDLHGVRVSGVLKPNQMKFLPLNVETPPVPKLSHGLDRVLFK